MVYYGPVQNFEKPSYFKQTNCLHVAFEDNTEITVSYKNIVSAWFDSEKAAIQKFKGDKLQEYRLAIYPEVLDLEISFGKVDAMIVKLILVTSTHLFHMLITVVMKNFDILWPISKTNAKKRILLSFTIV